MVEGAWVAQLALAASFFYVGLQLGLGRRSHGAAGLVAMAALAMGFIAATLLGQELNLWVVINGFVFAAGVATSERFLPSSSEASIEPRRSDGFRAAPIGLVHAGLVLVVARFYSWRLGAVLFLLAAATALVLAFGLPWWRRRSTKVAKP
jgi:hypothetical protein